MATGWVKSLQCKSRAADDVVQSHHLHLLPSAAASSCRKSVQSLKDVVDTTRSAGSKHKHHRKHRPPPPPPPPQPRTTTKHQSVSRKPEPAPNNYTNFSRTSTSGRNPRGSDSFFPALTELPAGHPSRNVVEIIFHTSWSPKSFSGRIEMVFKVQNLARTVSRFEEYREIVKSGRGGAYDAGGGEMREDHARCVADGNEVMRFQCLGPTGGGAYDAGGGAWTFHSGKGAAMCTYSGSGGAHESAGGGSGRKAMLVCRVIAGRVCKQCDFGSLLDRRVGFDSVSGENGELLVFDPRAVLPCFLVIYKL